MEVAHPVLQPFSHVSFCFHSVISCISASTVRSIVLNAAHECGAQQYLIGKPCLFVNHPGSVSNSFCVLSLEDVHFDDQ